MYEPIQLKTKIVSVRNSISWSLRGIITLLLAAIAGVQIVHAATIQVFNGYDTGPGSLRQALINANDGDTIQLYNNRPAMEVVLTSGELLVNKSVTITPYNVSQKVTVARSTAGGTPAFRIFHIAPGKTVSISSLTITNGAGVAAAGNNFGRGAGIWNDHATLTINNCTVSGNMIIADPSSLNVSFGGGIYSDNSDGGDATLTINNSTVSRNVAVQGGGIGIVGGAGGRLNSVTISNSNVSDNSAFQGGGIYEDAFRSGSTTLTINNCTISGNAAYSLRERPPDSGALGFGGGIKTFGRITIVISNSTLSGNWANLLGGGIFAEEGNRETPLTVNNSTLSGNSVSREEGHGGGIYIEQCRLRIGNTILKSGPSGANIDGDRISLLVESLGHNLSNDNGGGVLTATGDHTNTDPRLGPLQNNGGPTLTHAPLMGSPAIDMGDPNFTSPPDYDQRGSGYPRVVNGRLDVGAIEAQATPPRPTPTPRP
jgi:hypothetical protein